MRIRKMLQWRFMKVIRKVLSRECIEENIKRDFIKFYSQVIDICVFILK